MRARQSLRRGANTCGVTGPCRPHRGGAYLPVRVANDRDLEAAGAYGSESRMAEEPRAGMGYVCLCVGKLAETTLVA